MNWRFVNTGLRSAAFNMRFDECLAGQLSYGFPLATLRVYGWQPHAISLGFHQKLSDIDVERCRADGIDVVHRPTGGRAILHAHELTYSVIMFSEGKGVAEVYAHIGKALLASLRRLGVEAEMAKSGLGSTGLYDDPMSRDFVSCFTSTARSEIQFGGKKLVGSAQRRYGEVVLQHGSLLLGPEHRRLSDYVVRSDGRDKDAMLRMLTERTTDVGTILERKVSFDDAARALRKGFEETWGITFVDEEVHGEPFMQIQSLSEVLWPTS